MPAKKATTKKQVKKAVKKAVTKQKPTEAVEPVDVVTVSINEVGNTPKPSDTPKKPTKKKTTKPKKKG